MEIKFYKPQNPKLQKYIERFYNLKHFSQDQVTRYLAFPNTLTVVTAIKNAQVNVKNNNVNIKQCSDKSIKINMVSKFNEPALIRYEGNTNKFVTLFKPLGLNAFFDENLEQYSDEHYPKFNPFADFEDSMKGIFELKDLDNQFSELEDYWLTKLKSFEHPYLVDVLNEFTQEDNLSISDIASKYNISRMTLNKHFKVHMGKTPAQYRKIVRFRKALEKHATEIRKHQLTDIAYYLNYYDQSHMIKDFKSLTGHSPKDFFSKISNLNNERLYWMFL